MVKYVGLYGDIYVNPLFGSAAFHTDNAGYIVIVPGKGCSCNGHDTKTRCEVGIHAINCQITAYGQMGNRNDLPRLTSP